MSTIRISADSTCDFSPELIQKYNVSIMPLLVGLGEEYFEDGVNITPTDIYAYVAKTKALPKTAARSLANYTDYFAELTQNGDAVLHFAISSDMSSSYQNACVAAADCEGKVVVIDSRNLSTGIGLLMLDAADMIAEGKEIEAIAEELNRRTALVRASFVVDTLDYLRMGGRCSSVAALGANMLRLHPCIEVKDGKMGVGSKYRGPMVRVLVQYTADILKKTENINPKNVFITHTDCDPAVVAAVRAEVEKAGIFENIYETTAGGTINSHCGKGTLGVLFEVNE